MNKQKPKPTHSGIKVEGDWEEICGFARNLEGILKESYEKEDTEEDMDDSIEGYNKWRPREEEDEEDLTKKTAEEASIEEKSLEKEFQGTDEELKSAGKKVKEGINGAKEKGKSAILEVKDQASWDVDDILKVESDNASEETYDEENPEESERNDENRTEILENKSATAELKDATKNINRLVGSKSIQSLRKMEKAIYEQIMLKFNPYYFDTEHFSINLEKKCEDQYLLRVNIPDEDLREVIKEGLNGET